MVWSQNVVMNIADRDRLYAEIHRALKPGGRYAFADVVAGSGGPVHFPVPWARDPAHSFLLTSEATRIKLESAQFRIDVLGDQTEVAIARQRARVRSVNAPSALGVHIVMGADGPERMASSLRNLEEGRIGLVHGVARRAP